MGYGGRTRTRFFRSDIWGWTVDRRTTRVCLSAHVCILSAMYVAMWRTVEMLGYIHMYIGLGRCIGRQAGSFFPARQVDR